MKDLKLKLKNLHPDTMVVPLTPKPTRKTEALVRAPPTIPSGKFVNNR